MSGGGAHLTISDLTIREGCRRPPAAVTGSGALTAPPCWTAPTSRTTDRPGCEAVREVTARGCRVTATAGHPDCTCCLWVVVNRCQRACTGQPPQALTPLQGCLHCAGLHCSRAQLPQPRNSQLKVARQAQRLVQLLLLPRAPPPAHPINSSGESSPCKLLQADSTSCVFRACSTSNTCASQARHSCSTVGPDGVRKASRALKPLQDTTQ